MYVKDIFYSFQGEGLFVGAPQIFIRFFGCNIHCAYCDEPDFAHQKENVSLEAVLERLKPYDDKRVHSVSITGGEPLLHVAAIKELAPHIPFPLYLETNATLPDKLAEVMDLFTYFSVDYKPGHEEKFKEFMAVLKDRTGVFVKFVMVPDTTDEELTFLSETMGIHYPEVPVFIQPVTPFAEITHKVDPNRIFEAYEILSTHIQDLRVIPQTHKFIGVK